MNAIIATLKLNVLSAAIAAIASRWARISEIFWFCVSFCLFILMGPFSVIAVIGGLHSLAKSTQNSAQPEPARA
jgi:hypothetical protein